MRRGHQTVSKSSGINSVESLLATLINNNLDEVLGPLAPRLDIAGGTEQVRRELEGSLDCISMRPDPSPRIVACANQLRHHTACADSSLSL